MRQSKERINVYLQQEGEKLIKLPNDEAYLSIPLFNYYPNVGDVVQLCYLGRKGENVRDQWGYASVIHQNSDKQSIVLSKSSIPDTEVVSLLRKRPSISKMNSLLSLNHAYQLIVVDENYQIKESRIIKGREGSKVRDAHHLQENFKRGKVPLILPSKFKGHGLLTSETFYPYYWIPIVTLQKK
jgi:hypothetical protein